MEDFIRLNLNAFLGLVGFLIVLFIVYFIVKKNIEDEYKKYVKITLWAILVIAFLIVLSTLVTQTSVNNLQKAPPDRKFTEQSQQTYQENVLKNAKEKK
jgi:uncharacterized membrane protein